MNNYLLFDVPFWIQNNLKVIIKTFSTIYLSLVAIFYSVPSEGIPTFFLVTVVTISIGYTKTRKTAPETANKKG